MEIFGFIYKTTNLINGKIYIGQHVVRDKNTLDHNYIGIRYKCITNGIINKRLNDRIEMPEGFKLGRIKLQLTK